MTDEQGTSPGVTRVPPPMRREESAARLEAGLGSSRYKEYDIAPYAQIVQTAVPQPLWSGVFFSWESMKGHLQGLHGFDRTQMFATLVDDTVYATFIVVWSNSYAISGWMESGYPVEEMLRAMRIPEPDIHVQLVRDFS